MEAINGKTYPMWGQFVDKKSEWIGGMMQESDTHCGDSPLEKITDIRMVPNGDDSALFVVCGESFEWGADVKYAGIGGQQGDKPGLTISTPWGSSLRIEKPNATT